MVRFRNWFVLFLVAVVGTVLLVTLASGMGNLGAVRRSVAVEPPYPTGVELLASGEWKVTPTGTHPDDALNIQWVVENDTTSDPLVINLGQGTFVLGDENYEPVPVPVLIGDYKVYKYSSNDSTIFLHGNRQIILRGELGGIGPDGKPKPLTVLKRGYHTITVGVTPRFYRFIPECTPANLLDYKDEIEAIRFGWAPDYFVRDIEVNESGGRTVRTNYKFHLDIMGSVYSDTDPTSPYPEFRGTPVRAPSPSELFPAGHEYYNDPEPEAYRVVLPDDVTPGVRFGIEGVEINFPKGNPIWVGAGSGGYIKNCHFVDARTGDSTVWLYHHTKAIPNCPLQEWPLSLIQLASAGLKSRPWLGEPQPAPVDNISGDVSITDNYFDCKFRISVVNKEGKPILADPLGIPVVPETIDTNFEPDVFEESFDYFPFFWDKPTIKATYRVRGISIPFCNCVTDSNILFKDNLLVGVGAGVIDNCFFPHKQNGVPAACSGDRVEFLDNEFHNVAFGVGHPESPGQGYYAGYVRPFWAPIFSIGPIGKDKPPSSVTVVSGNKCYITSGCSAGIAGTHMTNATFRDNILHSTGPEIIPFAFSADNSCLIANNKLSGVGLCNLLFAGEYNSNTVKNNDFRESFANLAQVYLGCGGGNNTFTNNTYGPAGFAGTICKTNDNTFTNENYIGKEGFPPYVGFLELPPPPIPPIPPFFGPGCMSLGYPLPFVTPPNPCTEGNKVVALKEGEQLQGFDLCSQIWDWSVYCPPDYTSKNDIPGIEKCEAVPQGIIDSMRAKQTEVEEKIEESIKNLPLFGLGRSAN